MCKFIIIWVIVLLLCAQLFLLFILLQVEYDHGQWQSAGDGQWNRSGVWHSTKLASQWSLHVLRVSVELGKLPLIWLNLATNCIIPGTSKCDFQVRVCMYTAWFPQIVKLINRNLCISDFSLTSWRFFFFFLQVYSMIQLIICAVSYFTVYSKTNSYSSKA